MRDTRCVVLLAACLTLAGCARANDSRPADTAVAAAAPRPDTTPVPRARPATTAASASDLAASACDYALGLDSVESPEFATVGEFVRVLHTDGAANPDPRQDVHFTALDRLLSYVSDSGITYVDVNTVGDVQGELEGETTTTNPDTIAHVSRDSLRLLLRTERGSLYGNLQTLAKVVFDTSSGYTVTHYCRIPDGVVAIFGIHDYSLTFRRQGGRLRLTRFAALEVAAD